MENTQQRRWGRKAWGIAVAGVAAGLIGAGTLALLSDDPGAASTPTPATSIIPATTDPGSPPASSPAPTSQIVNRTISVSGEGRITVKPDTATISLGVQADGDKAVDALETTNTKMDALIKAIKNAGVAEEDITTSSLNIYSRYDNNGRPSGFTASNQLTVKVHGVDKAGPVIDAAAAAAGENITLNGISFDVGDQESVLGEARKAAVDNARKRAGEFAAAAGVNVGAVMQISEVGVSIPQPMYQMAAAEDAAGGSRAMATPIMAGDQSMTVNVTVVFELT